MYKDIRFRILLGNRNELRPQTFPPSDPWAAQRQLSLPERLALTGDPVYELKSQFLPPNVDPKHETSHDEFGGRDNIPRNTLSLWIEEEAQEILWELGGVNSQNILAVRWIHVFTKTYQSSERKLEATILCHQR